MSTTDGMYEVTMRRTADFGRGLMGPGKVLVTEREARSLGISVQGQQPAKAAAAAPAEQKGKYDLPKAELVKIAEDRKIQVTRSDNREDLEPLVSDYQAALEKADKAGGQPNGPQLVQDAPGASNTDPQPNPFEGMSMDDLQSEADLRSLNVEGQDGAEPTEADYINALTAAVQAEEQ